MKDPVRHVEAGAPIDVRLWLYAPSEFWGPAGTLTVNDGKKKLKAFTIKSSDLGSIRGRSLVWRQVKLHVKYSGDG